MKRRAELAIRPATSADHPHGLEKAFNLAPDAVQKLIHDHRVLVADLEGVLIGALLFEYVWTRKPLVSFVWVNDRYRRRGVARELLGALETRLRGEGHTLLLSSTQVDNPLGYAWHRAAGFEECGIIAGMNSGGLGEVFFRKAL